MDTEMRNSPDAGSLIAWVDAIDRIAISVDGVVNSLDCRILMNTDRWRIKRTHSIHDGGSEKSDDC